MSSLVQQRLYRPRRSSAGIHLWLLNAIYYLGKNPSTCIHFHSRLQVQFEYYRPSLGGRLSPSTQVPNWESLKVIALDKMCVNSNLSSGNLFP
jgi:hypothetical protein